MSIVFFSYLRNICIYFNKRVGIYIYHYYIYISTIRRSYQQENTETLFTCVFHPATLIKGGFLQSYVAPRAVYQYFVGGPNNSRNDILKKWSFELLKSGHSPPCCLREQCIIFKNFYQISQQLYHKLHDHASS